MAFPDRTRGECGIRWVARFEIGNLRRWIIRQGSYCFKPLWCKNSRRLRAEIFLFPVWCDVIVEKISPQRQSVSPSSACLKARWLNAYFSYHLIQKCCACSPEPYSHHPSRWRQGTNYFHRSRKLWRISDLRKCVGMEMITKLVMGQNGDDHQASDGSGWRWSPS